MWSDFTHSVAACLAYPDPPSQAQLALVEAILVERPDEPAPTVEDLRRWQARIDDAFPNNDRLALVYGGATKIKGYVFEAPKLPEIRGASALLDWVNQRALPALWRAELGPSIGVKEAAACVIVAGGGTFAACAPSARGPDLAAAIEASYAEHTITASSVAVARSFTLLEFAYGRDPLGYWTDRFALDWENAELRPLLASYYYGGASESPERRFARRKTFGELVTLLAGAASRRREARGDERPDENSRLRDPVHVPLAAWALRCASSGVRPAVALAQTPDGERPLSEASALKLLVGRLLKGRGSAEAWYDEYFERRPRILDEGEWTSWDGHFQQFLRSEGAATPYASARHPAEPAQDIGEIAQASRPARYIGFIYADGNNAGRKLASLHTPAEYRSFGERLDRDMRGATFAALAERLSPANVLDEKGRPRTIHPFEIITIGGDDVLLIVPGGAALEIALTLGYEFERRQGTARRREACGRYPSIPPGGHDFWSYEPELGLSAGVVIAPENTPIFFLRDLAEELLKSAKQRARALPGCGGTIDFMALKSVTMVTDSIGQFRRQAFGGEGPCVPRGSARPYLWPELQGLLHGARLLAPDRFPRSQLHRLSARLLEARHEGGIAPSVVDYLHATASGLRGPARDALLETIQSWTGALTRDVPPWLQREVHVELREGGQARLPAYESILADLAEIVEFVTKERRDG